MQLSDIRKEIQRLVDLIRYHNECYFQKGVYEISHYAYDQLLERLIKLEEAYPHFKLAHSPTEELGERPSKSFPVAYHQTPMLTLTKTFSEEEVTQFVLRIRKGLSDPFIDFICELKIDGIALSIVYDNGNLVRVVTRGDGEKGNDITRNAVQCLKLLEKIEDAPCGSFEVRGEAFMSKSIFTTLNSTRKKQDAALWANPRNITAGTLKTLDLDLVKDRQLEFYGYSFYSQTYPCYTQQEALALLSRLGFAIAPTYKVCYDVREIMEYIHYWEQHKNDLPFGIDGIVIKVNQLHQQDVIGITSRSPRWTIAYKYQSEVAHSILEKVTFQVGRTGAVTPVAHFKPILLAGTRVSRASLYNADELARRDFHLGDTIFVEKGGEIIPKVVGVDATCRNKASIPIIFVDTCPACGTTLHRAAGEAVYFCSNKQQCFPQLKGALLHFAHRKAMDIDSLGPKTVEALLEAKIIRTAADLYKLNYEQVSTLGGFQKVSTQKLLANIQASKIKSFDKVLFALGVKHVGETVAKSLALYFKNIEQLQRATATELLQVPDVGEKIAQSILDYLQDPYEQKILIGLRVAGLKFALQEEAYLSRKLSLSSKKIVISGTFQQFTRKELIKLIEQAGGRLVPSISANVDYLVAGTKASPSKLSKVAALAIPVLGENDIMNMIQL